MKAVGIFGVLVMASSVAQAQDCAATESAMLFASSPTAGDHFGWSVTMGEGLIVVGAPDEDEFGENAGAAYVFGLVEGQWVQQSKLASDDIESSDFFGNWISVSGDHMVIGAPGDDDHGSRSGSAYVFAFDGVSWVQDAKLTASDAGSTDFFGTAVSISGSTIVVGATRNDENGANAGAAYVFTSDGVQWSEQARLLAPDGAEFDAFGTAVAVSDGRVVIGAPEDDDNGSSSGSVYVYEHDGKQWAQQAKIIAPDGVAADFFALSIAISDNTMLIGSYWDDDNLANSGSVYVYTYEAKQWVHQTKLIAPHTTLQSQFGFSVAISGNTAIIGANQDDGGSPDSGSAYIFHFDGSQWDDGIEIFAADSEPMDKFGGAVAIWDGVAVSGAAGHDGVGIDTGAVSVFDIECSCPADLTGNGVLDFFDISAFLTAFSNQDPIADFTGEGTFDFFDISAFLAAFSAGCP